MNAMMKVDGNIWYIWL